MIKLFSNHILIRDHSGRQQPFDLEALREDLLASFRAKNIGEGWIAESIVEAVYEHLCLGEQGVGKSASRLSRPQIDQLVGTILVNAGYEEVATDYGRRHPGRPGPGEDLKASPWDGERIGNLLKRRFPALIASGRAEEIAARVAAKLRLLNFAEVEDQLIVSLVDHAAQQVEKASPPEESAGSSPQSACLIPSDQWPGICRDPAVLDLLTRRILSVAPVSRVVPVARLCLHLDRLACLAGEGPLTELAFIPLLHRIAPALRQAMTIVRLQMCDRLPHAALHPVRLSLGGMDELLLKSFGPMGQGQRRQLARELQAVIRAETVAVLDFPVVLAG